MVKHRKLLLKMQEQNTDDPPFSSSKKLWPPFQLIKKLMTHPRILPPPPVDIMNGPLFMESWNIKAHYKWNYSTFYATN